MAITKIIAIRDRLDKRVNYAVNGEKTTLDTGITYAANPEKTEQLFFTSAINCESCETAFAEMQATKQRFGKLGGVVGYHFIQSFAPGEVTPEQAHAIGVEFAQRLFGKRYEVVVGTHLDKVHLHNHVVVNSVSFVDGKKYHSSPGSYYFEVRSTSDTLCRENDLSTITPQGKGKHYAEWKAENTGKPTIRSIIRGDIDRFIGEAYTYETFLMLLRQEGYVVRNAPSRKYVTVLPPGGKRAIRLDSVIQKYLVFNGLRYSVGATEKPIAYFLHRMGHGIEDTIEIQLLLCMDAGCVFEDDGIRYYMNSREAGKHNLPHVHVDIRHEDSGSFSIIDGKQLSKEIIKSSDVKKIQKKIAAKKEELIKYWNEHTDGLTVDLDQALGLIGY